MKMTFKEAFDFVTANTEPCDHSMGHLWVECDPGCPDCGSHSGYCCQYCMEGVDAVFDYKLYQAIEVILDANRLNPTTDISNSGG